MEEEEEEEEEEEVHSPQDLPTEEQLLLLVEQSTGSSVTLCRSRSAPPCKSSSVAQYRSKNVTL